MEAPVLKLYRKLNALPLSRYIFNFAVGFKAPFFRTIRPNIVELKPSLCKVQMKERWGIKNHIGTVNAGAMCTIAELIGIRCNNFCGSSMDTQRHDGGLFGEG